MRRLWLLVPLCVALSSCSAAYSSFTAAAPTIWQAGQFEGSGFAEINGFDAHLDYSPLDHLTVGASVVKGENRSLYGEGRVGGYVRLPSERPNRSSIAGFSLSYGIGRVDQEYNGGELHMGGPEVFEQGRGQRAMLLAFYRSSYGPGVGLRYSHFVLPEATQHYRTMMDSVTYQEHTNDISGRADLLEIYGFLDFELSPQALFEFQFSVTHNQSDPQLPFDLNKVMIGTGVRYRIW